MWKMMITIGLTGQSRMTEAFSGLLEQRVALLK